MENRNVRMVVLCAGLACVTSMALGSAPAPTVDAHSVGRAAEAWHADVDQARLQRFPNLNEVPPIPMPQLAPSSADHPGGVSFFNAETRERVDMPTLRLPGEGGQLPGFDGADGGGSPMDMFTSRGFGTMSNISSSGASFPYRMNCKLLMHFTTTTGGDAWFVGSGSMIDSRTVLTAAHCVFDRDSNVNNWATEIFVFPGWDGQGNYFGTPDIFNYNGYARGTYFAAGSNYVNGGSFDSDIGVIAVDRGVGFVTGWYGQAWGYDCATIQGRTYYNGSFPAEGCGTSGLHNGADQYFWSGTFDSCPGNQLHLNTTPGCFTAVWGGMSGSGAYYFVGSDRFVHASCSNSNRSTSGQYAKIWDTMFTYINDTFIPVARGSTFNIQALDSNFGPAVVHAGSQTTLQNFLCANVSSVDPGNATYGLDIRLSTNALISTGDTLLSSQAFSWDFAPDSSVRVNCGAVTIPANTPPGNYYIGVWMNSGDTITGDNDSSYWDAVPIQVLAPLPTNDACSDAISISTGTTLGSNQYATNDGFTTCGGTSGTGTTGKDVWYTFTAPCSGTVIFDTVGSELQAAPALTDTVLSIHSACSSGSTSNSLACNDDSGGTLRSSITMDVVRGTTYRIRVAGYAGTEGNFQLNVNYAPIGNDECPASTTLVRNVPAAYSTCNATASTPALEAQCNFFGLQTFGSDVWFDFVADRTGTTTVSVCDSNFDTKIAAYGACPSVAGRVLACNDDSCGLRSTISFATVSGRTYHLRLGGYSTAAGSGNVVFGTRCAADYNGDDVVDLFDYLDFLSAFSSGSAAADFNQDSVVDFFDYLDFVAAFAAGC